MKSTLLILIGLPASGKSTFATNLVDLDPSWVRVSRDSLRSMMNNSTEKTVFGYTMERTVTDMQRSIVGTLLDSGKKVVLDDTNLRRKYVKEWVEFAHKKGHAVEFQKFDFCLTTLLERNRRRADAVPEELLISLHSRFTKNDVVSLNPQLLYKQVQKEVLHTVAEPYWADKSKLPCVLVDIDGTVAHNNSGRSPYDWSKVYDDDVNEPVANLVKELSLLYQIVFVSGRSAVCQDETERWLMDKMGWNGPITLFMRPENDNRKDSVVKMEIFDEQIRYNYNVLFCLDDRDQVVKMYRDLGLTVLQVAEGAF